MPKSSIGGAKGSGWSTGTGSTKLPKYGSKFPFVAANRMIGPRLPNYGAVPANLYTKHRYCEHLDMYTDATTGLPPIAAEFSLNSIYDPNLAVGGHQPHQTDQIKTMYNHYKVYKVTIQIQVEGVQSQNGCCCIQLVNSETLSSWLMTGRRVYEIKEQTNCVVIPGNVNGQGSTFEFTSYLADLEGITRSQYWDDAYYSAQVTASPTKQPRLRVTGADYLENTSQRISVNVGIIYHVQWSKPITNISS